MDFSYWFPNLLVIANYAVLGRSAILEPVQIELEDNGKGFGPDGPWRAIRVNICPLPSLQTLFRPCSSYHVYPSESLGSAVVVPKGDNDSSCLVPSSSQAANISVPAIRQHDDPDSCLRAEFEDLVCYNSGPCNNKSISIMANCDCPNYTEVGTLNAVDMLNSTNFSSFGLHLGSVVPNQSSSLWLGGYGQNRVLRPVGLFNFGPSFGSPYHSPSGYLVDVLLGVEKGLSPFNDSGEISVSRTFSNFTPEKKNAPPDSVIFFVEPAAPYIILPPGTCEAAASYLPVDFDEKTGLFLWRMDDPQYASITSSPAYLALVLADANANNVTIKVPFLLLNLVPGSSPAANSQRYFPCQTLLELRGSKAPSWSFLIGRAFLQAAFFAVNQNAGVGFLAQAPGPNLKMKQTVVKPIGPSDQSLEPKPSDSFVDSWDSIWTPIPEPVSSNSASSLNSSISSTNNAEPNKLSSGSIAGIAVCSIAGLMIVIGSVIFYYRRKSKKPLDLKGKQPTKELRGKPINELGNYGFKGEVEAPVLYEAGGRGVHEAPTEPMTLRNMEIKRKSTVHTSKNEARFKNFASSKNPRVQSL